MAETNTISNLDPIEALAYNDLMPVDDQNDLDIFGAPITKNYTSLQMYQYALRAGGPQTILEDCLVATTGNLAATYSNGTLGEGATLTLTATGALTIDGRAMEVDDRVLVWVQTSEFENGVYTVTNAGDVGINAILTRATDFDTSAEMRLGACASILAGATNIGNTFEMYTAGTITVGTTSILWRFPNAVLVSTNNALSVSGSANLILNVSAFSNLTMPSGTKTIYGTGDAPTYASITFNNNTGIRTTTTSGETALLAAYDNNDAAYRVFGTLTAGNTPSLALAAPSGGVLTISNVTGTTSASNPSSGIVGELLEASLAAGSAVSLTTGVNTDICNIPYTAGDWIVTANPRFVYSGNTSTSILVFVGSASGDNQTGITAFNTNHIEHPTTGSSGTAGGTITYFFRTSSSGTLYLKMNAAFSVGTASAYGAMQMKRLS